MAVAIVTGSGGLVGSETVEQLVQDGYRVVGLENDLRARFFGPDASTKPVTERLTERFLEFTSVEVDIRDAEGVRRVFAEHRGSIEIVVHAAAQP
jgi:CDP-paratose 2-epimerase